MNDKDTSVIPRGFYCYDEKGMVEVLDKDGNPIGFESAHELGISFLWDKVKECGLNEGG